MRRTTVTISLGLGMASSAAADLTVYSQPTTPEAAGVGLGFYSQSEPRANKNYKHADDFTLSQDASIGRVVWWGQSSKHTHADLTNFDSFLIEFFAVRVVNGQSLPGEVLATHYFQIGETSPTATGRLTPSGAIEYRHEAALAIPFETLAQTRYFIAVSAGMVLTTASSDAWQWQDSSLVNGRSGVYSWATRAWSGFQDTDSAFELVAVPAPASVVPLAAVLWALPRRRRGI